MSRTLSTREKRLLVGCIAAVLVAGTTLLLSEFTDRSAALTKAIDSLKAEKEGNEVWLQDAAFQAKRQKWLDANLPTTESLGRAQGLLVDEVTNQMLDMGMELQKTTPNLAVTNANYSEISATFDIRGETTKVLAWLAYLQSPEKFTIVKTLNLDPDGRAKETVPMVMCKVTIARWFKPQA
jgi:Type II secretion system (T2SS), protein M subtype b